MRGVLTPKREIRIKDDQRTAMEDVMCWLRRWCRSKLVRHTGCALITVAYVARMPDARG